MFLLELKYILPKHLQFYELPTNKVTLKYVFPTYIRFKVILIQIRETVFIQVVVQIKAYRSYILEQNIFYIFLTLAYKFLENVLQISYPIMNSNIIKQMVKPVAFSIALA